MELSSGQSRECALENKLGDDDGLVGWVEGVLVEPSSEELSTRDSNRGTDSSSVELSSRSAKGGIPKRESSSEESADWLIDVEFISGLEVPVIPESLLL
jgi:hypothetical protein